MNLYGSTVTPSILAIILPDLSHSFIFVVDCGSVIIGSVEVPMPVIFSLVLVDSLVVTADVVSPIFTPLVEDS
uniref:Uncharacterized protein n=1 Tax=Parascaris equorum TaxID=6256 RepID=A0A914RIB0_PAREQ